MATFAVALGPRREVASLEATAIASGGCRGNTAGARGAGLMLRRRRTQAGRARSRQPGPRRAGLFDALRATVHWLSQADGRRRRSEDREPRREAGRLTDRLRDLPFAEQYAGWQRAWRLGSPAQDRSATRISCSALPGMISLPSEPATLYKACATPTASAEHRTALAGSCAYGASRLEAPRSSGGSGGPPDVPRLRHWRTLGPTSRRREQVLALGEGAHPGGPPAAPDLFFSLEPHPVL